MTHFPFCVGRALANAGCNRPLERPRWKQAPTSAQPVDPDVIIATTSASSRSFSRERTIDVSCFPLTISRGSSSFVTKESAGRISTREASKERPSTADGSVASIRSYALCFCSAFSAPRMITSAPRSAPSVSTMIFIFFFPRPKAEGAPRL